MKKFLLTLTLLIITGCSTKITNKSTTKFEEYLTRAEAFGYSGIVHYKKEDSVIINSAKGFRNFNLKLKNDSETLYYIASISKSFTSAAILKLEDENKLKVADPICIYIENCPIDKKEITIHQLLSHTSGIKSFGWNNKSKDWKVLTKLKAIEGILNSKLANKTKFNYNNANYVLLAAIIEKASGKSYQEYISEKLLIPMGLNNTHFGYTLKGERTNIARNYINGYDYKSYLEYPKSWLRIGGGDILSTASDLNKWISSLYKGDVLTEKSKSKLFTIQTELSENFGYSYGWYIREFPNVNKSVIFHTGGFKSFSSEVRYYPHDDKSIVVFSNNGTIPKITEIITNDLVSLEHSDSISIPKTKPIISDISYFKGKYIIDSTSHIVINKMKDYNLVAKAHGQNALLLFHENSDHYETMLTLNNLTNNLLTNLHKNPKNAFKKVLPKEDLIYLQEYIDEWKLFVGNKKYSHKVHHSTYLGNDIYRTYISIKTNKNTKYFGFTWKNNQLIGTVPSEKYSTRSVNLLPYSKNELITYDWDKRTSQKWLFDKRNRDSVYLEIKLKNNTILKAYKE